MNRAYVQASSGKVNFTTNFATSRGIPFAMSASRLLILLGIFLSHGLLAAPTDRYEELTGEQDDYDVVEKPWKEIRGEIPSIPAAGQWTEVQIDSLPRNQHAFLALDSVTVGEKDLVVRYWLSIRSDGGGFMTTYEGVHCSQRNYVVYAYAYPNRKPPLRKVHIPKWKPIPAARSMRYRAELVDDVFCSGSVPRSVRQIRQAALGRYEQANPFDNWTNDD